VALKRAVVCVDTVQSTFLLLGFLCLFWQENGLDVWQNTTLGNGDTRQEFVQFLVVYDGQL
jgi:hypothetical protein